MTLEGERAEVGGRDPRASDWLEELRAPFLTASVVPVLVAGALAAHELGEVDLGLLLVTLLGVALLHLGANVSNDYWDYVGGTDVVNRQRTPFSGGSRTLVERRLSPLQVRRLGMALLVAGSLVGVYLVYRLGEDGWVVLLIGVLGVGGAYFYSAPPLSLASRGVGEVTIGGCFGLLTVLGAYYVQARTIDLEALAAGVPVSMWIAAVVWVNQFPDAEADAATGKRTLVVRMGLQRSTAAYSTMQVSSAGVLVGAVILGLLPVTALLALLFLVPTAAAISVLGRSHGEYPGMVPAMRFTIIAHLLGGLGLATGLLL